MNLKYLDFDYSEDAEGNGTLDAMASVAPAQIYALHAEISAVLVWAHQHWPGACGPSEDGGEWHYDLHGVQEVSTPLMMEFDEDSGQIHTALGSPSLPRATLTLTLSGSAAFCAAARDAFGIE